MAPESSRIRVIGYAGIVLTGIYLGVHSCLAAREKNEEAAVLRTLSSLNLDKKRPTAEASAAEAHAEKSPQATETRTTATAKPAPRSGPFGLAAGMTLAELQTIGKVEMDPEADSYSMLVPPIPDPEFQEYLLMVGRATGLCKIGAVGKSIRTASGKELKASFNEMDRRLQAQYGPRDNRELEKTHHAWDPSSQWMVGLLKKELRYASIWGKEVPLRKKIDRIDWLVLDAHAESLHEGYLSVIFAFDNLAQCEAEDEQEKSKKEAQPRVLDPTERSTPGRGAGARHQ